MIKFRIYGKIKKCSKPPTKWIYCIHLYTIIYTNNTNLHPSKIKAAAPPNHWRAPPRRYEVSAQCRWPPRWCLQKNGSSRHLLSIFPWKTHLWRGPKKKRIPRNIIHFMLWCSMKNLGIYFFSSCVFRF